MILLDRYYVSKKLTKTLEMLQIPIGKLNEFSLENEKNLNVVSREQFIQQYFKNQKLILANSESALTFLNEYLPNEPITYLSNVFKNKHHFRTSLSKLYPNFYYKQVSISELKKLNASSIPFPIVLKPTIGYSSIGVYYIENKEQYREIVKEIENEYGSYSSSYSPVIINTQSFILEQYIDGEEYAVDCYFNHDGEPVILNVFSRLFLNKQDTKDRVYYTSKKVLKQVLHDIHKFLQTIGDFYQLKTIPLHIELRINNEGHILPVEVNPLRFAGIGTTELGIYAYNINPYEYYFTQQKPDWDHIIETMDDQIYSFSCAEYDEHIDGHLIEEIDHEGIMRHFDDILEYRIMPYKDYTTFAVIFFRSPTMEQNKKILDLDFHPFIKQKQFAF